MLGDTLIVTINHYLSIMVFSEANVQFSMLQFFMCYILSDSIIKTFGHLRVQKVQGTRTDGKELKIIDKILEELINLLKKIEC